MTAPTLDLYRVLEGPDVHVVIASSQEQARGVAFGHRFSDDEGGEWPVHRAAHLALVGRVHDEEQGIRTPVSWYLDKARESGRPVYVGGSCS